MADTPQAGDILSPDSGPGQGGRGNPHATAEQRREKRNERRRDLARYKGGFPYRERGVHADTQTVVSMQLKRKLTAYDMRASSSVRPGRSTRREASWSLAGRTRT